jgi:hypothetical protein
MDGKRAKATHNIKRWKEVPHVISPFMEDYFKSSSFLVLEKFPKPQ